jgi:hypothetical protein
MRVDIVLMKPKEKEFLNILIIKVLKLLNLSEKKDVIVSLDILMKKV